MKKSLKVLSASLAACFALTSLAVVNATEGYVAPGTKAEPSTSINLTDANWTNDDQKAFDAEKDALGEQINGFDKKVDQEALVSKKVCYFVQEIAKLQHEYSHVDDNKAYAKSLVKMSPYTFYSVDSTSSAVKNSETSSTEDLLLTSGQQAKLEKLLSKNSELNKMVYKDENTVANDNHEAYEAKLKAPYTVTDASTDWWGDSKAANVKTVMDAINTNVKAIEDLLNTVKADKMMNDAMMRYYGPEVSSEVTQGRLNDLYLAKAKENARMLAALALAKKFNFRLAGCNLPVELPASTTAQVPAQGAKKDSVPNTASTAYFFYPQVPQVNSQYVMFVFKAPEAKKEEVKYLYTYEQIFNMNLTALTVKSATAGQGAQAFFFYK